MQLVSWGRCLTAWLLNVSRSREDHQGKKEKYEADGSRGFEHQPMYTLRIREVNRHFCHPQLDT